MTVIYPAGAPAYGRTSVVALLTLSSESAPSLLTDFASPNALNMSCFLYGDLAATSETSTGNAPRRICDTSQFQQFGSTTFTIGPLQYVYNPQGDDTDEANSVKEMLAPDLVLWVAERNGKPARSEDIVAGDLLNLHHIRLGPVQNRTKTGDDEFSDFSITQGAVYIEAPIYDVAVAA